MRAALGFAASALFVLGCGAHHTGPSDGDISQATLTIDPPSSMLMITNGTAATEDFTATLTFPNGTMKDVTGDTDFGIQSTFGSFSAAKLSMSAAGKAQVFATYLDKTGNAEVIATLKGVRVDPGVPPNAPDLFNGPDNPAHAPALVYPAANVLMPRNVGDFEVHWTDASSDDVFEVSLKTDYADVRAYVPGGNGDTAAGPDPSYMAFLASEWASVVGTETKVQLQVRGVNSANPVDVGSTAPQMVNLSNETMNGGLYYWASKGTEPEGIYRHDMSKPGQPAEPYFTTDTIKGSEFGCVACHVLSRDGKKMMITYDGGDQAATTIDVASSTATPVAAGASCTDSSTCGVGMGCVKKVCRTTWNFATYSPDATQILSVFDGGLYVRDATNLNVLAQMAAAGPVSHPDLSPDGKMLVYVRKVVDGSDWAFGSGQIFMRTYDQASQAFGAEQQLVADTNNNYYPSFSPDGQWVLFNRGDNFIDDNANQHETYNNPNATVWVVKSDNSAPPVQLSAFNSTGAITNSWARWAPFAQTFGANNEQMYWITVSSKRDFGVRLVNQNKPQIWMTPFFPARAAANQDPSAVAFRLPFQDIATNNHIAQWTEQVVVTARLK